MTTASAPAIRRERVIVCAIAVALVLIRSFVATYYEGFYFDSDQAIVGLMARDLSRLHRFPLFYYSLNYLLAVQAWIIAPLFVIARPSVALMRAPFVVLNAGVAVALILTLVSQARLRPAIAFVAALPFIIPSPGAANQLLELAGACVEPIAYVVILWFLRRRPLVFGAVLAFGYLHREFTIFALPALLIAERREWLAAPRASVRRFAWLLAGFAVVWLIIAVLKVRLATGSLGLQLASLRGQMCLDAASLQENVEALFTEALPSLFGLMSLPVSTWRMTTPVVAGSQFVGTIVYATFALAAFRIFVPGRKGPGLPADPTRLTHQTYPAYLALTGVFTACAYPLSCAVALHAPPLLRYLLVALLIPVGLAGAFFARERSRALRAIVIAAIVFWSGANLADNVTLIRTAVADPPLSEHRALATYLVAHRIRYARAIYWDAYVTDFLSRGRVVVASTDIVRIPEYQDQVDAHAEDSVMLQRLPCSGNERVASWCVQRAR